MTPIRLFEDTPTADIPPAAAPPSFPASITATASGQPPEWGPYALDIVFAGRKGYRKTVVGAAAAELVRALWTYALARHEALLARKSAQTAAASLAGHRMLHDKLDSALRLIESHGIEVHDIPAARQFEALLDLRGLAGDSPFPERPSMDSAATIDHLTGAA